MPSSSKESFVIEFYQRIDSFLETQIGYSIGKTDIKDVEAEHESLLGFLSNSTWDDSFQEVVDRHIAEISGAAINVFGFSQFKNLDQKADPSEHLARERDKLGECKFTDILDIPHKKLFDPIAKSISSSREEWIINNDVNLKMPPNPVSLMSKLFVLDGFDSKSVAVELFETKNGRFFMARLHSQRKCLVGHGEIRTLFNASTFAHEMGHTTTPEEVDLWKKFQSIGPSSESIHDEFDSYRYEKIFMDNLPFLIEGIGSELVQDQEKLRTRKALQYNYHLLDCFLSFLFFKGASMQAIADEFRVVAQDFFGDTRLSNLSWWDFATLSKPLSKLGYVRSFQRVFKTSN